MFKRRTTPTAEPGLVYVVDGEDVVLSLTRNLAAEPVSVWFSVVPGAAAPLAEAMAAAEDERRATDGRPLVAVETDRLRLHPAFVSRLSVAAAGALGLPPPTALALDLRPRGRIDQDEFRIETRWLRPGGQPAHAQLRGSILTTDAGDRRVPEPLWSLHRAADALSRPLDRDARFRALSDLRAHWPEDARSVVETDPYLAELRVHYASALSLKLGRGGPFDFDPVLFGAPAISSADAEGRLVNEDADSVLTPTMQRLFAEDRFRREREARSVYLLRDGQYVVVDPALRPALDEVRRLQDAPEPERRDFVLNPRRVLRERLGDQIADRTGLDDLFIETEQFSARVAGVDIWRTPVLPWLMPPGKNQWLPERFGLRVGETYAVVPPSHVEALIQRVENAAACGEPSTDVAGLLEAVEGGPPAPTELPVNDQTRAALQALAPFATAHSAMQAGANEDATKADLQHVSQEKLFLLVRENFDEVEFAALDSAAGEVANTAPLIPPDRLCTALKPHQRLGLTWLAEAARTGRPGALLADDMGLGKTLQAIAFMAWLQDEAEVGRRDREPFLVVAPTGLLSTWRDEIARHLRSPHLGPLLPAFGSDLKALREEDGFGQRDIDTGRAALRSEAWREAGVVLTTYETLRDYHFSFARTRFGLVVFDEIQKLKNPASQLTRAAKTLNGAFTLGMTGTPVENRLQDLWSLMDVVAPGFLGSSRDFERRHPAEDTAALQRLKVSLTEGRDGRAPLMLRRMKRDEIDGLPSKHVHSRQIDMPPLQADAYRDLVVRASAGADLMGRGGMLSTLAAMRGVSLHPLDPRHAPADLNAYAAESARLTWTMEILTEVAERDEKALIFVEDLVMQERLAALIQSTFRLARRPHRISGAVPGPKRQGLVNDFQAGSRGFDAMILSPKAGGVGLTITAANHVVHLSRWWNPAVEDQATDRVFRIGQTRDVHVYLPMAVHPDPMIRPSSFDLRLDALIERKRNLTRDLFLPPDVGDADLAELFREVSLGASGSAEVPPLPTAREPRPPEAVTAFAPDTRAGRAVLSLPKASATELGVRVWRVPAGATRPTDEVLTPFEGRDLAHVRIVDPYALGSAASRDAQVKLLAALSKRARSMLTVTVEYASDIDGDAPESLQRSDFGKRMIQSFGGTPPRLALSGRRRRAGGDDFHDRSVEVEVRGAGGALQTHVIMIGRGAEALFDTRRECSVTYAPPSLSGH